MESRSKRSVKLIVLALYIATSTEIAIAFPVLQSLVSTRSSIDIVANNIRESETVDADDKSYQLAREISWIPQLAYYKSVEAFLEGDYTKYTEYISKYEIRTDSSNSYINSEALLKLYTNVVASDFAEVNLRKFAQALEIDELKNLTAEDYKAAEAAYYYASGNHDGLRELVDKDSISESFNRAFSVYLLTKMEGDIGSVQHAINSLAKFAESEAGVNEPNFLSGLANLFIADLYPSILRETPSGEKLGQLEVALAFARNAEINLSVYDYGSFYGLAHLYRGNIMKAVYDRPSYKDKEIERIFEISEMFR